MVCVRTRGALPLGCPDPNEACIDNLCVADPCTEVECGPAEVCYRGQCLPDPCQGLECPRNQRCAVIGGTAQCVADWPINPLQGTNMGGESGSADVGMGGSAGMAGEEEPGPSRFRHGQRCGWRIERVGRLGDVRR